MNKEQAEIIVKLINIRAKICSHPQIPPDSWEEEADSLEEMLIESTQES